MQVEDIERSLAALSQELQNLGVQKPIRLLLVGGAFMLTQIGNRPSTGAQLVADPLALPQTPDTHTLR
jgi:hypothetical protein